MMWPWHVITLVPAHNEEVLLPRCLHSVIAASEMLSGLATSDIVVAVDRSTDRTYDLAKKMLRGRGSVITTQMGAVGNARRLAAEASLRRYRGPLERCWLANTDADSWVPNFWLIKQIALAEHGVSAVAGTITVDSFEGHRSETEQRFRESYHVEPDGRHNHVHGANLGFRADVYRRAGGWKDFETAEDHDLWRRIVNTGAQCCSTDWIKIITSGRRIGRAPNGFAAALAAP